MRLSYIGLKYEISLWYILLCRIEFADDRELTGKWVVHTDTCVFTMGETSVDENF